MNYINPPEHAPANFFHRTLYSQILQHEIGYCIYLPPDYESDYDRYPLAIHLHGWTGSESTEIHAMEKICRSRRTITVFPNSSPTIEDRENLPIESFILREFIPFIDREYRTIAAPGNRTISGFSMGGGAAFYYAAKYPELFAAVIAYAGTYHHYYGKASTTVGADPAEAHALRELILRPENRSERNILSLLDQNADRIRGHVRIELRVGSEDVLHCDNEILHLHLDSLCIPHQYITIPGVEHALSSIT